MMANDIGKKELIYICGLCAFCRDMHPFCKGLVKVIDNIKFYHSKVHLWHLRDKL